MKNVPKAVLTDFGEVMVSDVLLEYILDLVEDNNKHSGLTTFIKICHEEKADPQDILDSFEKDMK